MKKIWLLVMLLAVMTVFSGCEGLEDVKDELIANAKQEVTEWAKDTIGGLWDKTKETVSGWTDSVGDWFEEQKEEYTLTFVTGDGEYMEPVQVTRWKGYKVKTYPIRQNHHFLGWTTDPECQGDSVVYGPKDKIKVQEDMTLYAVWLSEADLIDPTVDKHHLPTTAYIGHSCEAVLKKGRWGNPDSVEVTCTRCDMVLSNPGVSKETFALYCADPEEAERMYVLYAAREYGPAVLSLMAKLKLDAPKQDKLEAVEWLDPLQKLLDCTGDAADVDSLYGLLAADGNTMGETMQNRITSQNFFDNLKDDVENGTDMINFFRACCYFSGALDSQQGLADQTVYMLKTLDTVISYAPASSYYEKLLEVLQEGVKLWDKCEKHNSQYYEVLDEALKTAKQGYSPDLTRYIHGQYETVLEQAANGRHSEYSPTAMEVIDRILADPAAYRCVSNGDRFLINFYVAETLNYEFRQRTGVDLDTYVEYLKNDKDENS